MGFWSVLTMAHKLVAERVHPGDTGVDATCGTGADTRFLARLVGRAGQVYSFDIQQAAIEHARSSLAEQADRVAFIQDSHAQLHHYVQAPIGVAMFNLGYLPLEQADKSIITMPESTVSALQQAFSLLKVGGILTVVCYPGHEGGAIEAQAVEDWARALSVAEAQVIIYRMIQKASAPYLIAVERSRKPFA